MNFLRTAYAYARKFAGKGVDAFQALTENGRISAVIAFVVGIVVVLLLAGCGKADVSFATLEEQRGIARENAIFNAQRYRQENVLVKGWDIVARGDSTQAPACPQGDGWATMDFVSPEKRIVKVKCSTVSSQLQCLDDADFKTKPFASEDGRCNGSIPESLPKIAK